MNYNVAASLSATVNSLKMRKDGARPHFEQKKAGLQNYFFYKHALRNELNSALAEGRTLAEPFLLGRENYWI